MADAEARGRIKRTMRLGLHGEGCTIALPR